MDLDRSQWSRLSASTPLPLTADDVERLRGLGDPIDLAEVDAIYRPLSRLLALYVEATGRLHAASSTFLGGGHRPDALTSSGSAGRSRWASPPPRACCAS